MGLIIFNNNFNIIIYYYNHERMYAPLSGGDNIVTPAMAYKYKMVVK